MTHAGAAPPRTGYRVRAMSVEACSCAHGCNCQFGGTPNEGKCEFVIGYDVQEGRFGKVDLHGFRAVVAAKYPGAIHEGRGHAVLFVDRECRPDQVGAFATIIAGKVGGMPWEALAGTIERFEGPSRGRSTWRSRGSGPISESRTRSKWRRRHSRTR